MILVSNLIDFSLLSVPFFLHRWIIPNLSDEGGVWNVHAGFWSLSTLVGSFMTSFPSFVVFRALVGKSTFLFAAFYFHK